MGISRRQLIGRTVAATTAVLAVLSLDSPAQAKMAQTNAGYQAQPKGDQKCSGCALFKEPSSCVMVDGTISPDGWCKLFTKKSS